MQIIVPISRFGTWQSTRLRSRDFVIPNDFLSFECPVSVPFSSCLSPVFRLTKLVERIVEWVPGRQSCLDTDPDGAPTITRNRRSNFSLAPRDSFRIFVLFDPGQINYERWACF